MVVSGGLKSIGDGGWQNLAAKVVRFLHEEIAHLQHTLLLGPNRQEYGPTQSPHRRLNDNQRGIGSLHDIGSTSGWGAKAAIDMSTSTLPLKVEPGPAILCFARSHRSRNVGRLHRIREERLL